MNTVAIVGAGNVGRALGERLRQAGAVVRFGVRDPVSAANTFSGPLAGVPALSPAAAAAEADIVFLAVPAAAAVDATRSAVDRTGKILVDCTNPLRWSDGPVWAPPPQGSVAQALAITFPAITVIKGFNHFGAEIHRSPDLMGGPADAFFAGDDGGAKSQLLKLAARMGFRAHDAGPLRNAALLENLAVLWIQLATSGGVGRNFSFRIDERRT